MDLRNFTNEELCRRTMSQDASPLERELAQRLEAVIFRTEQEEDDCGCYQCQPSLWS